MTAEEFKRKFPPNIPINQIMCEFAKAHVKEALRLAAKNAKTYTETHFSPYSSEWEERIDEKSIINAYPESNII